MNRFNKILVMVFSLALLTFACKEDDVTTDEGKGKENPSLNYEGDTIWLPEVKGDTLVPVKDVNGAYSVTVTEGGDWCTVEDFALYGFKINYADNRRTEYRSAKIAISMPGLDTIKFIARQRGPYPILDMDTVKFRELSLPYLASDTVIPVIKTNGDYTVKADQDWVTPTSAAETGFGLRIAQNGLANRSAKVNVSLTYRDSTVGFEFVIDQISEPIHLVSPADGTEFDRSGFSESFKWEKIGARPSYSIAVSTNSNFSDGTTSLIEAGDEDHYTLTLSDLAHVMSISYGDKVPLYWKVIPTDPTTIMPTETRGFYVFRNLATWTPDEKTYDLTLNNNGSSYIGSFNEEEDGSYTIMTNNTGRSSRRVFLGSSPLTEEIPADKIIVATYECKIPPNERYTDNAVRIVHGLNDGRGPEAGQVLCPISNEWQSFRVTLRTGGPNWGKVGERFFFWFQPPTITGADQFFDMYFYVRNIKLITYDAK